MNIFCVPALGWGQEDEEDHKGERGLVLGGIHNLHLSVPLPRCDISSCPPKCCKVAFPMVSSVTPVMSPKDLFHS